MTVPSRHDPVVHESLRDVQGRLQPVVSALLDRLSQQGDKGFSGETTHGLICDYGLFFREFAMLLRALSRYGPAYQSLVRMVSLDANTIFQQVTAERSVHDVDVRAALTWADQSTGSMAKSASVIPAGLRIAGRHRASGLASWGYEVLGNAGGEVNARLAKRLTASSSDPEINKESIWQLFTVVRNYAALAQYPDRNFGPPGLPIVYRQLFSS
jgi:hypothetical protein